MKSAVISLVVLMVCTLFVNGCGGGSSSSGAEESSSKPTPTERITSIEINPLLELGLEKGAICIRIKAYSNTAVSKFSEAICTKISDSNPIELSWNHSVSQSIIGYEIYYGDSKNNASNFLQNIMTL